MKYLCVSADGSFEIWDRIFIGQTPEQDIWISYLNIGDTYGMRPILFDKTPEYWGREIIDEWNE